MTLNDILNATEGNHFEFKEAKNRQDIAEAAKYLCAMSNHGGGRLVLGVTDKRPRKVVGSEACSHPESTILHFMDKLHVRVDFQIYKDEKGKRVLVFEVASRPIGLPVQSEGIAWWREGDRLIPMPEKVRRAIYEEGGHDFTAEICKDITLDDLGNQSEIVSDRLPIEISDREQMVLKYMESHDSVTTAELAKLIEMSQRSVLSIVQKLIADGYIEKDGNNRHSTYSLKK